jgi:hypothetical protein
MTVDQDDVALVRRAFEEFHVASEDLEEYFHRFFAPDGVVEYVDGFPLPARYEGFEEGYKRWFEESYAHYDGVRRRLDSITAEGNRVVALLTISGRQKGDHVELTVQMGNTYELEHGRIRHLRIYLGHERALEAARERT